MFAYWGIGKLNRDLFMKNFIVSVCAICIVLLVMKTCNAITSSSQSESEIPFIGNWEGVFVDNHSGAYANETIQLQYRISIYADGSCIIEESAHTNSINYKNIYKGRWEKKTESFANQTYEWIILNGSTGERATTLLMTSDGNIYFHPSIPIRNNTPMFKVQRVNSENTSNSVKPQNTTNVAPSQNPNNWIYGKWLVNTSELGLVTVTLNNDNTIIMDEGKYETSHTGIFEMKNNTLYCYFENNNTQLPLNITSQTIDFGEGYTLRKSNKYSTSNNYIESKPSTDIPNIEDKESSEYTTTRIVERKTYFHSQPYSSYKEKTYLLEDDIVDIIETKNNYAYIEFTNTTGQITKGWIQISDLYIP